MGAHFYLNTGSNGLYSDLLSSASLSGDSDEYVYSSLTSSEQNSDGTELLMLSSSLSPPPTDILELDNLKNNKFLLQTASDGDQSSLSALRIVDAPKFIVGHNMDDVEGATEAFAVGDGFGAITGGNNSDTLIGDFGGSTLEGQKQNYNVVFVLDTSGSMSAASSTGESRLELMVRSVNELIEDFSAFEGGDIKVHITSFNTSHDNSRTFTVTNPDEYNDAINFMNNLSDGGYTNYEAGLQGAVDWLQNGDAIENATTTTYFLSDGFPNYAIDDATGEFVYTSSHSGISAMDHILGLDGSNEVAAIQALSDEVIGVGISIGDSISNLQLIDSDGNALNVPADQLVAMMQETNPMTKLASVGDDIINAGDSNDIIFGDALYTDDLAATHGLSTTGGDGWSVFEQLENGQSTINVNWNRDDTISYIVNNAEQLSQETITDEGLTRIGGNDIINGGSGEDLIFGQEGDDIIIGSAGNDILYGGSGADVFLYEMLQDRIDVIKDFDVSEGDAIDLSDLVSSFDPVQDSIDDFIFLFEQNGNTRVFVDTSGTDPITSLAEVVTVEGVTDLDLGEMITNGSLIIE